MLRRLRIETVGETEKEVEDELHDLQSAIEEAVGDYYNLDNSVRWILRDGGVFPVYDPPFKMDHNTTQKIVGYTGRRVVVFERG